MNPIFETIGYLASITVAVSLLLTSMIKLRWINMGGAFLFVVYGLCIKSYPVALLNTFCVLINLYHIYNYYKKRDYFRLLKIRAESQLLREFLHFYKYDILKFFPDFEKKYTEDLHCYFVLRDMIPAGVFMFDIHDLNKAEIMLEYVTPKYRDTQVGRFLFYENSKFFTDMGINSFFIEKPDKKHVAYIESIGFKQYKEKPEIYEIELSKLW